MVVYTRSALVSLSTNYIGTDSRPSIETPTLSPSSLHPVIATPTIPGNKPTSCPTPPPFGASHGDENTSPSTTDTPVILLSTEATTIAQPPATCTQSPPATVASEHPPAGLDQMINKK